MKAYSVDYIISKVRAVLDENGLNDADFMDFDQDNVEFDKTLRVCMLDSANQIHLKAPQRLLDSIELPGAITFNPDNSGFIQLPTTLNNRFLRLHSFKMSDWKIQANSIIDESSVEYNKQQDEFARGTWELPIVAIVSDSADNERLEFYSCKNNSATVTRKLYIPRQEKTQMISNVESIYLSRRVEDSFIYLCAAMIMQAYGDKRYELLIQTSNTFLK